MWMRSSRCPAGSARAGQPRRPGHGPNGGAAVVSETTLTEPQRRLLHTILERGADGASQALSKWLDRPVRLEVGEVEEVELEAATEASGPSDTLVAACSMPVSGRISGILILAFEDRAGLALADLLQRLPLGTTTEWGELERSAAQETANIVGCAYLNALASHLPGGSGPIEP